MTLPFARSIGSDPTKTAPNQLAPTQGGQLEGTLTGATPGGQGKTLPAATGIEGSSAAFSSLMRQLQQSVIRAQPSAMDKLRNFRATTGLEAMTTGAITGAIGAGEKERLEGITETFKTTVDLMKEQEERKEKQRQENTRWGEMLFKSIDNPLSVFSGEDIENMKLGIVTPEMQKKVQASPQIRQQKITSSATPEIKSLEKEFGKTGAQKLEQAGLTSADRQDQLTFIYGTPQEKESIRKKISTPSKPTGTIRDATEVTEFINEQKEFGDSFDAIIDSLMEAFGIKRELATRLVRINF